MKIVLEFDSFTEMQNYFEQFYKGMDKAKREAEELSVPAASSFPTRIQVGTRRQYFADMEIAFIKENYQTKKITWIARALHRKPEAIYQQLYKMYKAGLPKRSSRNGKVKEQ
jgi:hypothetical protein